MSLPASSQREEERWPRKTSRRAARPRRCRRRPPACSRPRRRRKSASGSPPTGPRPRRWRGGTSKRSARTTCRARQRCGPTTGARTCAARGVFVGPEGLREFTSSLIEAIPDLNVEIVSTTTEDERCALHWRFCGTFAGPGSFNGIAPTGHRMELEGVDVLSGARRADPLERRFHRHDGRATPDRDDAAASLARRAADDGRLQRQDARDRRADRRRRRGQARGRGRVGRAGPARPLQRVSARERRRTGRRDDVRRGRAHDDPRGGARGRATRRDHADRARPRAHRPPRHRAGAGRARAVPSRGGPGRRGQRRVALLARATSPGCRRPSARSTACCTAMPSTAAR